MSDLPRRSFLQRAAAFAALPTSTSTASRGGHSRRTPRGFYYAGPTPVDIGVALPDLEGSLQVEDELTVRGTHCGDGESFVELVAYLDAGGITYGFTPADAYVFARDVAEAARFAEGGK